MERLGRLEVGHADTARVLWREEKKMEYVVVWAPEGCAEEFIGNADSLAEARALIARHESGELPGTEAHLWATARAASRQVPGCSAPPEWYDGSLEPLEWAGSDGCYAIVARQRLRLRCSR